MHPYFRALTALAVVVAAAPADPGKRFLSMQVIDEDQYTPATGRITYTLDGAWKFPEARPASDPGRN